MGKAELRKFRLSGYVQVAVWADIEAKNKKEAQKMFDDSLGGGLSFDYQEGGWESEVIQDEDIEEIEEGV